MIFKNMVLLLLLLANVKVSDMLFVLLQVCGMYQRSKVRWQAKNFS